jgi:hypothetical protein
MDTEAPTPATPPGGREANIDAHHTLVFPMTPSRSRSTRLPVRQRTSTSVLVAS